MTLPFKPVLIESKKQGKSKHAYQRHGRPNVLVAENFAGATVHEMADDAHAHEREQLERESHKIKRSFHAKRYA